MESESVLFEAREGVAIVTLNRPEVLNAFNAEMLHALRDCLHRAERQGLRCVLLSGAGRAFSAGQDLSAIQDDYAKGGPDFNVILRELYHPVLRGIRTLPMPVVAAVNGVAAGAGMSLALACDIRLASENARFATAFSKIGLIPDAGMAYTLPRLVGAGRANWMLATAEPVDAGAALAMGLVDQVMPAADFPAQAFAFATKMAAGPTKAFVITRRLLDDAATCDFGHVLDLEAGAQAEAGATQDHRMAVASFLEKKPPTFQGR